MPKHPLCTILGAMILALSLTPAAHAACTYPPVTSVKGKISGTFYATDGTITKVACDLQLDRLDAGYASFEWGNDCPGLSTYGSSVFMLPAESQRIVKSSVPQKSCVISNKYVFDVNRMDFVTIGTATTTDTSEPTVLLKEKGTLNFVRNDGVFAGKYSVSYPKP